VQAFSAAKFYQSEKIVNCYEQGRTARLFIKNPLRVLACLEHDKLSFQIPLYTFLDWIYRKRLVRYTAPVLYGKILDVGCGTSYVYRTLIENGWKGKVSGLDSSQAMLTEGTRVIDAMLNDAAISFETLGNLYIFKDSLGREVLDSSPPVLVADKESLVYLKQHRTFGDLTTALPEGFSTITAFAGPLCFFPVAEQRQLLTNILSRSAKYAALQFKNAAFYSMNSSPSLLKEIAGLIEHLIDYHIVDSYAYLQSLSYTPQIRLPALAPSAAIEHEVGGFFHYPLSLTEIIELANQLGFTVLFSGSMGFASETFFDLFRRRYTETAQNPAEMREFFLIMAGVDEYFCTKLIWGENLHITFVRRSDTTFTTFDYSFEQPYRIAYMARSDGGGER
jgi:SAM-dependent methyltransferase